MAFYAVKACALAALAVSASAQAQVYPARPIRMIVAYPPGGGTDIVGRMAAQKAGARRSGRSSGPGCGV